MTFIPMLAVRNGASVVHARDDDGGLVAIIAHPCPVSPWFVHHFNRRLKDRCRTLAEARALVLELYEPIPETSTAA
jgi:hypothetical protein